MLKNLLSKRKLQEGFTIIEVMIVLAIAGLILVVVLIAIPQLQRNQRNENRRSVMARVVTEINSYAGNNNGKIPGSVAADIDDDLESIEDRYLGCTPGDPPTDCDVNVEDPSTDVAMDLQAGSDAAGTVPALDDSTGADLGILYYQTDLVCDGEELANGEARNFVVYTVLEGGAIYCLDNR